MPGSSLVAAIREGTTIRRLSMALIALVAVVSGAIPLVLGRPSLYVALEALTVALAFAPALAVVGLGRLTIEDHLPFWTIYGEALIYLFVAPAAWVAKGMPDPGSVAPIYVVVQLAIIALFLVPLVVVYQFFAARNPTTPVRWVFSGRSLAAFIPVCILLPLLYVAILAKNGLLFRRIGFQGIAEAFVGLPRTDFLVIRGFESLAIPLLCLLVLALRDATGWLRAGLLVSLVSVGAVTLFDASLNSRLQWILTLGLPLIVALNARSLTSPPWRAWVAIGLMAAAMLYGVRLVENIRVSYSPGQSLSAKQLNPTLGGARYDAETPLAFRLDGLDLMARMTPGAISHGYSWGKSWWPPIVVEFGQVFDPKLANQYKLAGATEPKWYLMRDYHVAKLTDYPSSALTDAYGNFGPIGLLGAALLYAFLLAKLTRWARAGSAIQLVLALFLLADLTYFEGSFIGIALRWAPYAPAVILLLLVNPLRRGRRVASPAAVEASVPE